jgi:DNA ligase D-like protein (predicted 3'-phosphoesterase)
MASRQLSTIISHCADQPDRTGITVLSGKRSESMPPEGSLEEYAGKRQFGETPEPEPKIEDSGQNRYVVQEHNASHLHWDFRLEMEGVLKSWAVPKGVPEESGVRRLAVQTEDHPISYMDFEGGIPEGQYGAGTVKIWDHGTFDLIQHDAKKIVFELSGERLHGSYALVNTRDKQWIVQKMKK